MAAPRGVRPHVQAQHNHTQTLVDAILLCTSQFIAFHPWSHRRRAQPWATLTERTRVDNLRHPFPEATSGSLSPQQSCLRL